MPGDLEHRHVRRSRYPEHGLGCLQGGRQLTPEETNRPQAPQRRVAQVVTLELLSERQRPLTGLLNLPCAPSVDGHQERGEEDLELELLLLPFRGRRQTTQTVDGVAEVLGRLAYGGALHGLVPSGLPEGKGFLALAGVGEVGGDELGALAI